MTNPNIDSQPKTNQDNKNEAGKPSQQTQQGGDSKGRQDNNANQQGGHSPDQNQQGQSGPKGRTDGGSQQQGDNNELDRPKGGQVEIDKSGSPSGQKFPTTGQK